MKYVSLLTALVISIPVSAQTDTLHIYFNTDDPFLNAKAEKRLEKEVKRIGVPEQILIIGYADDRGDEYYNDMLSMRRAQSVATFVQKNGVDSSLIKLVYGKGEVKRQEGSSGNARDRRVDMVVKSAPKPLEVKAASKVKNLDSLKAGETLVLRNIQFEGGTDVILPISLGALEDLYGQLKKNASVKVRIEGHICCSKEIPGDKTSDGYKLSLARARAVYNAMVEKGIDSTRMSYIGLSAWNYIGHINDAMNRRVEVRVMEK